MNISDLPINEQFKQILKKQGITTLYPPQAEAIKKGLLEGNNLVVAIPTASGKTLLAMLASLQILENEGQKVLYLSPLRALAYEKYLEFRKLFKPLGYRVVVMTGDYDQEDTKANIADIIIATNEKVDSALRHQSKWVRKLGLVVSDEVHLINDISRGPTLEVVLAQLRRITDAQILALSATIKNADQIARWLEAELVSSDWRPVKLKEGVLFGQTIRYKDDKKVILPALRKKPFENLIAYILKNKQQALIFCTTRNMAESTAKSLSKMVAKKLSLEDRRELNKIAEKILKSEEITQQSQKLAELVKMGVAYHHAGLNTQQRREIEEGIKKGSIKILTATPTLCLSKDTKIWHNMGEKSVDDSYRNNKIFALKGNKLVLTDIYDVQKNFNNEKLIRISTVSGFSIKVTPNHKMLIKRGKLKKIIPAKEILPTDKIATVGKLPIKHETKCYVNDFVLDNRTDVQNVEIDKDIAYLIGVMLGDGYSGAETIDNQVIYKGTASLVNNDIQLLNYISNICEKLNLSPKLSVNSYGTRELLISKHKWFREFLVRAGVEKGVNKHINEKLMAMSNETVSHLLRGLFDTDGYINKKRNIGISSISCKLIKDIQRLLLRFGIISRIREKPPRNIKIASKEYRCTNKVHELTIANKKSILRFYENIGFNIEKKQSALIELISIINSNIYYKKCPKCKYKLYSDVFTGRSQYQKAWGKHKLEIVRLLGQKGELPSRDIVRMLGFEPKKKVSRLNHHYEFIKKRKIGSVSPSEWFWSLNDIGQWIYNNIIRENKDYTDVMKLSVCPLCGTKLMTVLKKGWRDGDLDGDIYWDLIREIKEVDVETEVYDVVLSNNGGHDHLFVANGFIVHNSAGINLPARYVIIKSIYRYDVLTGNRPIPVLEFKQQSGRAGRPQYDDQGDAIVIAKSDYEAEELFNMYILADTEDIESRIATETALRKIVLGQIATGNAQSIEELLDFFSETFYGYQSDPIKLLTTINEVIDFLREEGFITKDPDYLIPTNFGKRVNELYIDPLSAVTIRTGLIEASTKAKQLITDLSILHLVSSTVDVRYSTIRKNEYPLFYNYINDHLDEFLLPLPADPFELGMFMNQLKTALILADWIEETPEDLIIERYNVGSGDIHMFVSNAEWLLYATSELGKLLGYDEVAAKAKELQKRVIHGIRRELLELVELPGIGRVRARNLYNHGITSPEIFVNTPSKVLCEIPGIGPEIVKNVFFYLLGKEEAHAKLADLPATSKTEKTRNETTTQKTLSDFF